MKYLLLDGRAASQEFKDSMVIVVGSAWECCRDANEGEYGDGCVIADLEGKIMWHWFESGRWSPK